LNVTSLQCSAHRLQDALDLVLDAIRVDDLSAIAHDREMLDAELPAPTIHLDGGDGTDIGAIELGTSVPDSRKTRRCGRPFAEGLAGDFRYPD